MLAEVIVSVISEEQFAFVKGKKILDGPFLLNEVVAWRKSTNNPLMIFKVDFEKAFDTISWDYVLEIMQIMGFGKLWCAWIMELIQSAKASVLVKGYPTNEFQIQRCLRQRDLLSPFFMHPGYGRSSCCFTESS